ncbi:MAG TPA: phosphoglycerate kinase [Methanoregulaceae archaeon]|nr:phosphoglycerate kinase [Methanolinea sp.]MDD3090242.1 phosphoglycerate kinase [Methanoregulaceae archaeon]MDD5047303.1 phosphoglycerate kinase [Methanoregulaceae archaeon]MDD5684883.1 phosphoglycerate kinase [Methanoregulaceae archaeon]HOP67142.1 phosphoglycerate kinase [Methanoregulaceae archaeon]
MPIGTLDQIQSAGKTVLLRLDLNSPIDPATNLILDDKRFREHIPTILALEKSRVVVVTHQSRPGKKDFTTLEAHAEKLAQLIQRPVTYVDDIFGHCARDAIRAMRIGDVLMLENVRFSAEENLKLKPEDAVKTHLVRKLAQMGDLFVNDAFGTAHRSQPTMVGLPLAMRSVAGLLMEKEVTTLSRVFDDAPGPVFMVLGGTKVDDSMDVAEHMLSQKIADRVLVTGVVANVFLMAMERDIGRPSSQLLAQLGYDGEIEHARTLLGMYPETIMVPEWVAVKEEGARAEYAVDAIPGDCPVLDLGMDSIISFSNEIKNAGTVVFNGPAGLFEEKDFATGTYELLRAASAVEFSVIGGGHTAAVAEKIGLEKNFTHISTGGGACIEFLTGKKLPAVDALERSKELFC